MSNHHPILCLDFDGVLHSYTSGWKGADVIPDPPVEGAIAFLREAVDNFEVHIFSSRSNQPGGLEAMARWIGKWVTEHRMSDQEDLAWMSEIKWPTEKPPALVTIDDRAICFTGKWPSMVMLKTFKPWNKRPKVAGQTYDMSIHQNPDAMAWAQLFRETHPGCNVADDVLHGWFANAMMAMHDSLLARTILNGDHMDALRTPARLVTGDGADLEDGI